MASEISSWKYEVFLSFRGEDTRNSFTGHLYEALVQAGINTFMDTEELNRGMEISQELCEAIDRSRFFLVFFSKNYASSTWCLDELVRIMSCMESCKEQMVWPVFYHVDPSEVRKQKGIFGEAFTVHEETFKEDLKKVERWRKTLTKAANLSGKHLDKRSESTLVKEIVQEILTKINRTLLMVAKNPVGICSHIEKLESALGIEFNDVRMIGIYGLGGIGKTTVAKAVHNCIGKHFEGCSFLSNIKEKCKFSRDDELTKLQESLLQDILLVKMHWNINFSDEGTNILRDRLRKKKVLIVLDDVDHSNQLEKLAGNISWFGPGSRVIITTRDKQLLVAHGVYWNYRVDELNKADSLELFCWNAFKKPHPNVNFDELSNVAVRYAAGHPLALIVVGASLFGCNESVWKSQLQKLEMIPNKDVYKILKLSFDGLEDHEKEIFLDIACFFRGNNIKKELVMSFLDSCGFYPDSGIEVLQKKCLIFIEKDKFEMHDLIQLMGREIVRQESPYNAGKRSRLWFHEDILQVLNENKGTKKVQGIFLDMPNVEVSLGAKAFSSMKNLRLLIIRNADVIIGTPRYLSNELRWLECGRSSSSIVPSTFHPKNLVVLDISHYPIKQLGIELKGFKNLSSLTLEDCETLTEIGDISLMSNLVSLELNRCSNLECFSNGLKSNSLRCLSLKSCRKLKKFPDILEEMRCLRELVLMECGVIELPTSMEKLTALQYLNLSCESLVHLPSSIYMLKRLEHILLNGCKRLEKFFQPSNSMAVSSHSEENYIQDLGSGISLKRLDLINTGLLELDFLTTFNYFVSSLVFLNLSGSKIRRLPKGMRKFKQLQFIVLDHSKHLEDISDLPPKIQWLDASGCDLLPKLDVTNFFDMDKLFKNGYLFQDWKELFLYQGVCNDMDVIFRVPGNEIPKSFEYCSTTTCCSVLLQLPLHVKKHVVGIMLCVLCNMKSSSLLFEVQINCMIVDKILPFFFYEFDHLWISYLPRNSKPVLDEVLKDDSSHFHVTVLHIEYNSSGDGLRKRTVENFGICLIFDEETYISSGMKRKII